MSKSVGWYQADLGSLSDRIDYGLTASSTAQEFGPRFLRITDLQDGNVNWDSVPYCECNEADRVRYSLSPGDIVFARTGATTGKSFLIRQVPPDTVFASYLIRVRPGKQVDSGFLAWFFQTPTYWRHISRSSTGTTQPGVNATKLRALSVPLPPLPEQRRIAAILDKADAIRRKRRESIRLLEEFLRSAFLEIFGDPVRNPKGWDVVPLHQLVDPTRPITYGILKPGPDQESGVPYIRVVDMVDEGIRDQVRRTTTDIALSYVRSTLKPGDLLMSIRGHVGRLAVVPEWLGGANITQDTARLALTSDVSSEYALGCLQSGGMQHVMSKFIKGAAVRGINLGDVKKLPIPLPPQAEQEEFARLKQTVDGLLQSVDASSAHSNDLFDSLAQQAFRGELQMSLREIQQPDVPESPHHRL